MVDQARLNQEQVTKVRQALSLNIYSTDRGTKTYINGNSFRIENPMTVPMDGVETPIGYVNTEGNVFYDVVVENGRVKARNTRVRVNKVTYTRVPDITAWGTPNANYRINTVVGDILNKTYDPITVPDVNILVVPQAPTEGTLVIKYVDNVTGATLWETSKKVPGNTNQSHTASEIFRATYKIIGDRLQNITVPSGQTRELTFRYNPIYGQIVKFIDKDTGREIQTQSYTPVTHGDPFRKDPPSIQGYRLVPGQNPINVPRVTGNGNYTFRYEKIPTTANVIVKHLNKANNQPLRGDVTLSNQTIGSNVTYNAPAITNYAPERTTYTHTVVEGNNVITVYYTENAKIRPWAIRKSNAWKSLNTTRQWMKIRRTANQNFWDTKPNAEIYATDTGKENYSPSRIRKGGKWKAQGKIGD